MGLMRFVLAAVVLTVCALAFFALGYIAGNQEGSAQTFRECIYNGQAELPSGGAITCQLLNLGKDGPPVAPPTQESPASAPGIPSHKPREKLWPPAGFDRIDSG